MCKVRLQGNNKSTIKSHQEINYNFVKSRGKIYWWYLCLYTSQSQESETTVSPVNTVDDVEVTRRFSFTYKIRLDSRSQSTELLGVKKLLLHKSNLLQNPTLIFNNFVNSARDLTDWYTKYDFSLFILKGGEIPHTFLFKTIISFLRHFGDDCNLGVLLMSIKMK